MERQFKIKSQKFLHNIKENTLTFIIDQMKCRTLAIVYFKLHAYDIHDDEILVNDDALYVGRRWIVSEQFQTYYETFEISTEQIRQIKNLQVELVMIRVNANNPLSFTGVRLANGGYDGIHRVSDVENIVHSIEFLDSGYANLYSEEVEDYLQVIRPTKTPFTTKQLTRCKYTVLAPHLVGESALDNPTNLFIEFLEQHEQETNIYNSGYKV